MKTIINLLISMIFVFMASLQMSVMACSPGTNITPVGSYVVTDANPGPNPSYAVYITLTDECPGTSAQTYITTLYASDLGNTQSIPGSLSIYINYLPDQSETALYYQIHITVYKYNNGNPNGSRARYSYADYDSSVQTFTARTQPIPVGF
jgi:hypothetical protein